MRIHCRVYRLSVKKISRIKYFPDCYAAGRLLGALSMTREILADGEIVREAENYAPSIAGGTIIAIVSRIKRDHYRVDVIRLAFTTK